MDFDEVPPLAAAYAGRTQTRRDVCVPLPVSGCGGVGRARAGNGLPRVLQCDLVASRPMIFFFL
jgi:hypothetical protein